MYRPNIKGGATFWQDGCALIETTAGMTAFTRDDTAISSDYIYPLLPHASSPAVDVVAWKLGRSAVSLTSLSRVAFGICLEAPVDDDDLGTMYEYSISARATVTTGDADISLIPAFGQLRGSNAAPVRNIGRTTGPTTPPNEACWTTVAGQYGGKLELHASGTVLVKRNISTIATTENTEGNPIIIACVVNNDSNNSRTLSSVNVHVSGMKYAAPLDVFVPHPYND